MSRIQKLIERFLSVPGDLTWDELAKIMHHLGYNELQSGKTGGSRRKFADATKHIISLHKPHPGSIVKKYAIRDIIASLKERGYFSNE